MRAEPLRLMARSITLRCRCEASSLTDTGAILGVTSSSLNPGRNHASESHPRSKELE